MPSLKRPSLLWLWSLLRLRLRLWSLRFSSQSSHQVVAPHHSQHVKLHVAQNMV